MALALLLLAPVFAWAGPPSIEKLIAETRTLPLSERIEHISSHFLGIHYVLDPFGEGISGKYDRDPVYRFDAFDCTTFVETVMALARAQDFHGFEKMIDRIRYSGGVVGYTTRNHFPEIDWIPNNARNGFFHDATVEIAGSFGVHYAEAVIDKRGWYEHMKLSQINVPGADEDERKALLADLRREGARFGHEFNRMPYLHLDTLLPEGKPNTALLDRIPSGSILNVVRPNWDLKETAGTNLNVSHQAFAIRKDGKLLIRHATTGQFKMVTEQPLEDYLRGLIGHPEVRGINVLIEDL